MSKPLTVLDLFSGIGGFSYAAERLVGGFETIAFCDSDEPCRKVLRKHWPDTPIFTDVCALTAQDIQPFCPDGLSLITAGFPCQDISVAGKQAGYNGKRSVLFYEIIRLARELRPKFLLLENVRNLLSHQNGETFQETLFQIAQAGYDAEWAVIPASDLGACHKRERIWIIAYANHAKWREDGASGCSEGRTQCLQGREEIPSGLAKPFAPSIVTDAQSRTSKQRPHRQAEHDSESARSKLPMAQSRDTHSSLLPTAYAQDRGNFGLDEQARTQLQLECMGEAGGALFTTYANHQRQQEQHPPSIADRSRWPCWSNAQRRLHPNWRSYLSKPVLRRGDDGLSNRVVRLKQLGNSIVPQVAAVPLQRIKELDQEMVS